MNVMGWDHLTILEDSNDALAIKERVVKLSDDECMKYIEGSWMSVVKRGKKKIRYYIPSTRQIKLTQSVIPKN